MKTASRVLKLTVKTLGENFGSHYSVLPAEVSMEKDDLFNCQYRIYFSPM